MTWSLTFSASRFDLGRPKADDVNLTDISHHLSVINRFSGATIRPYSVAEHSLLVADIAERELRLPRAGVLAALMHDAHEAYLGDITWPVKQMLGAHLQILEASLERAVQMRYGLRTWSHTYRDLIRSADRRALATERRDLMPAHDEPWSVLTGVEPVTWVDLTSSERCDCTWQEWRTAFVDRFAELNFGRVNEHVERHGAAAPLPR
jgi:hypothetical protein